MNRSEPSAELIPSVPRVVVVGAGVSGLSAAYELCRLRPDAEVIVLERGARAGGLVHTEHTTDGFVVEHGPDSLLAEKPATRRALEQLSLEGDVVCGTDAPRRSFLAQGSALVPMPEGLAAGIPSQLGPFLRSPLLSFAGKARLCVEPLVARSRQLHDESVASFVTRRFGRQVLERVVDPLMLGIYGAPAERLSVLASMPQLADLEHRYGSIAWGMHKTRSAREKLAAGGPQVVSLRGGMSTLTDAFAAQLGTRLQLGAQVMRIERGAKRRYRLQLTDRTLDADAIVMAAPAYAAAPLVEALDAGLAQALAEIPHGALASVSLAFARSDVPHPLDGTGFIVPATERRATSACSFMCRKWPGRAPEDHALLRSFVRGVAGDADADTDDQALSRAARSDLRDLMGIEATPLWTRIHRRERALPRYEVGHGERVAAMMARAAALFGFALAGNAYLGVGIGDCLASGQLAAERVAAALAAQV